LGSAAIPGERGVSWGTFEQFLGYAAKVNAFAPAWMIPFLGMAATVLELLFGVTLVLGLALRWAAFGSAGLLFLFGSAIAISFGIKSPFDYSVFAAMCCALFLGLAGSNRWTVDSLL
jgi:putative oxidoreductase